MKNILLILCILSVVGYADISKKYYDSGAVHMVFSVKNAKLDGKQIEYYKNGKIKNESVYKNEV
ncbi:MAG: hypothetical protein Q9M43_15890 [Sulfurimonas sp.]|nr:hypothetical protein [Sulfurimonas sp.]